MENYISAQAELYEQLRRAHINFKKTPKDRLSAIYINTKLELLCQVWSSFHENHLKLLRTFKRSELNETEYVTKEIYFNAEEEYSNAMICMKEKLKQVEPPVSTASLSSQYESVVQNQIDVRGADVRIPLMKIPTFNGQYTEWISFRDQFTSLIHNNSTLNDVQKLHYLKMHVSGEAANLMKTIPIAEKNYEHAWNKLNKRFSNNRVIANSYLQRLMSIKNITHESANSIKFVLDTTMDCLNGLNSIGVPTDNWDMIIIYLTTSKLDIESLKQWEDTVNKNRDNALPTIENLTDFLEARFRSLEGIQSTRTNNMRTKQHNDKRVFYSNDTTTKREKCTFCDGDHYIYKCNQFTALNYEEKKKFIEQRQLCYNCLVPNHTVKACRYRTRCHKCGKRHHSLIHPPDNNDEVRTYTRNREQTSENTIQSIATHGDDILTHFTERNKTKTHVLLATALVRAKSHNGKVIQLRALIDQGSQGSFITESAAQTLGLRRKTISGSISGIGDTAPLKAKHMINFTLRSNTDSAFELNVEAYILKTLTRLLPSRTVHVTWNHTKDLVLADPSYGTPGRVDLLLGAAVYCKILLEGVILGPIGAPIAQNTSLGWILSGEIETQSKIDTRVISMHAYTTEDDSLLRKFWEIESDETCKIKQRFTEEELLCEKIYKDTHTRDTDGRYIVTIPLKENNYDYGNTRDVAYRRLQQLERKLNKDEDLKNDYTKVLMEYKDLNHMEEIPTEKTGLHINTFYLPHHPVIRRDKTTTKVRIVFDASCKSLNRKSLNENMLIGPRLQRELRHIVMTWRTHEVAFVADCVKMYRQIKVTEKCSNLQRVLWMENGHIKEYKLNRVTFGTASAPYLATKTLQQLANDECLKYPIASELVKSDFYMDDILSGGDNLEEVCTIYRQMTDLLMSGGFEMQKWASNNKEFLKYVETKGFNTANDAYVIKNDDIVKTLGIRWDRKIDKFQYTTNLEIATSAPITKRTILRDISKLFDPIGWLAPIIIIAKVIIQKLWLSGVQWDQEIPKSIYDEWITYKSKFIEIRRISIPRWLNTNKNDKKRELHGYSDASTTAYAAVVYLRIIKANDTIHVEMITAKTKVAPTRTISVPRLELCGAVLLTKLLGEVSEQLQINKIDIHAYTDSRVVLAWLQSHPSKWKTYIANRTSDILSSLPSQHWHYIASGKNPADVASRGALPSQLIDHNLWWKGPKELWNKNIEYEQIKDNTTILEIKTMKVMTTTIREDFVLFTRYSNLIKLLRVTAYILRFFSKNKPNKIQLTGEEIVEARLKCIVLSQEQEYFSEINRLKNNQPIKKDSKIKSLNPFLDEKGILRVGGRLNFANLPNETKHQIILPHNHPFTKLVLADCHEKTLHGGPTLMMSCLRTKYWITNAKSLVRRVVHNCVVCVRFRGLSSKQMMGTLPEVRVTPAKPFLHSGVDLAGPIDFRLSKGRGCKTTKGYIVIFICMVTRAIHIEIVTGLSAQDFIAAFKRFVARRGHCSDMWSDNATNLTAGNKELMTLFERSIETVRAEIENLLANDGTTWHHIPAAAPHFGGLWEAGVKSIKFHLKRVLKNSTLTYEEMCTLTTQIESCLNSRPISPMSDDPSDLNSLTPGHFLLGEAPMTVPEDNYLNTKLNYLSRWQLTQRMYQDFWTRWSKEYLSRLQSRHKWVNKQPNINVGELVLIKEDNIPPSKWLMARVIETHPGKDSLIRVVTLKHKNGLTKRPITKICRLPIVDFEPQK